MHLENTTRISKKEIERTVELILDGIKPYANNRLLKSAKTKSMSSSKNNFILYKINGVIMAFLMYRLEKNYCVLYEIHVSEELRSRGIGSKLFEDFFKKMSNTLIILFVHKENKRAQSFYLSKGFEFQNEFENDSYYEMHRRN